MHKRVAILVDTSGSVFPFREELVNSTNDTLNSLYAFLNPSHTDVILVTVFLFDEKVRICNGINDCVLGYFSPRIALADITCGDGTALYDSIASTLESSLWDVLMVVTDGYDTFSEKHTKEDVQAMILAHRRTNNVRFVYVSIGAGAKEEGYKLGFHEAESLTFDSITDMTNPENSQMMASFLSQAIIDEQESSQKRAKKDKEEQEEIEASQYF